MTKSLLMIVAAIALTIGPACLHGRFANRWDSPADLSAAGAQLHEFPRQVGQWHNVTDERPLSEAVCRELGLVEHFHRQYRHQTSGERLDVLLLVGPPGRLVRHPPGICYASRGNQTSGEAKPLEISTESENHQFELLSFRRTAQPVPSEFSVAYAFATRDGVWSTPGSPRMTFGGKPVLYKLQVLSERQEVDARADVEKFLAAFVEAFPGVLQSANTTDVSTSD